MRQEYPDIPASEAEWQVHWAFYKLTVSQRDSAWRESARHARCVAVLRECVTMFHDGYSLVDIDGDRWAWRHPYTVLPQLHVTQEQKEAMGL